MSNQPFGRNVDDSVVLWTGCPNCQAAHDAVLQFLIDNCSPFVQSPSPDDHRLRGNLGETITFCIGSWQAFGDGYLNHFANALQPFSGISRPELDLLWVQLAQNPKDDRAVLQEVKTTGAATIDYANNLIEDYGKLFGTNPRLTLQARVQDFKNRLEFERGMKPADLMRVTRLCGVSPAQSPQIHIVPTVVHDTQATDVVETMIAIRETLLGDMWANVEPWAIGFDSLNSRLQRLAGGLT